MSTAETLLENIINCKNILLSGPGGTGKSYLIVNIIQKWAIQQSKNIFITSTTGVSALAIGGTTIHRWSGIKLGKDPFVKIISRIKKNKETFQRWKDCDILVIDEISMLGLSTLELLDRIAKVIRNSTLVFGGIQVVFSGDFLQLPPIDDDFCFKSQIWQNFNFSYHKLTIPKRYDDLEHFEMLQRIRVGKPSTDDIKKLKQRVNTYIDYIGNGGERKDTIKPTRIFSLKKDVDRHNLTELSKISSDEIIFNCIDKISLKKEQKEQKEQKEKLSTTEIQEYTEFMDTIVPYRLSFKVGSQVMLTYNLSIEDGLVNGSRGVVLSIPPDGKSVNVLFKNGLSCMIEYNLYEFEDDRVKFQRHQIPLVLAWGISIHKSQGCTLDYAIIDLGPNIFSPGMAYVALSRVKSLNGIYISSFLHGKIYADKEALDFEEILEL